MGLHTGDPCFACGKKFTETDDVVVCPACGTPYHRACWEKTGDCINLWLHREGKTWEREKEMPQVVEPPVRRRCTRCGAENPPEAEFCVRCGASFQGDSANTDPIPTDAASRSTGGQGTQSGEVPPQRETFSERFRKASAEFDALQSAYCGMDPEESLGGETVRDVSDFVEKNTLYYLPKFARFHKTGRRFSLNFACLLFPQYYLAYRKMWLPAILLAVALSLLNLPQNLWTLHSALPDLISAWGTGSSSMLASMYPGAEAFLQQLSDTLDQHQRVLYNISTVCNYFEICLVIFLGIFGNHFYYRFVLRRVRKIREEHLPESTHQSRLRTSGGTNGWLILAIFGIEYAITAVLFAIALLVLS